ncbi:MAG: hypothetical protein ABS84_04160 [Rubrivivax sp. SCN 71-131]|nr:MAG: hypothetical protein ABS84_04160 [Rubrivivax sp. SCN 71-131]
MFTSTQIIVLAMPVFELARVTRFDPPQQPLRLAAAAAAVLFVAALALTSMLPWHAHRWPLLPALATAVAVVALLLAVAGLTSAPRAAGPAG